jgi:glycosyltransferase involved in cell wall biosynthesis
MQAYERIVAGSTWLADLLRDRGLRQAVPVLQGVDRTRFSMSQPRTPSRSNFVVFSGGKMEFRKGQDIVISAFKIFRSRHPDARLHFSWDNIFAGQAATIGLRGLVTSAPEVRPETRHLVDGWLEANGLPPGSFRNLGLMGNQRIGEALADVHVAVFANRCEGGTNLVAMECMALGIPTILSANSGHLDLIDGDNCYALRRQGPVDSGPLRFGTSGWGESSVEELADCLELVYTQYAAAIERGRRGADTMKELNWSKQTRRLLQAIDWPVVVR